MVKWVDKIISNITKNRFFILAHSWGADIALHYMSTYPLKVMKVMLLDGGYYIRKDLNEYRASRSEVINSLKTEIDYYVKDFDEYCFDTLQEHIELEKGNYDRWSSLLEQASGDLIRIEDGKFKYHAKGCTSTAAIKSMYLHPTDSIYDKLPNSIYLLQSTLPESMGEIREVLVRKFKSNTRAKTKRIVGAGHLIHWDKPEEVAEEILNWFK